MSSTVTNYPEEIEPGDLQELLKEGKVTLIDCREPDEFAICKIEGAKLIPLGEFRAAYPAKFPSADERIVVHCHHGMRSLRAVRFLRQNGHSKAQSLAGGIDAWSLEIDPTVRRY